jgi:hypothetical protein
MKSQDGTRLELGELSDKELMASTALHRNLAAKGVPGAAELARQHEDEMSRRFGGETTVAAPFDEQPARPDHWWKFW